MRKAPMALLAAVVLMSGCAFQLGNRDESPAVPAGTLCDQQLAAYPMLEESPYLVLNDFERADQLQDFALADPDDQSRVFFTTTPAATGSGALGLSLGSEKDHRLVFRTLIRQWQDYNLFLSAIYSNGEEADCEIVIADAAGNAYRQSFGLAKGWNKLQLDLNAARKTVDLAKVGTVEFLFPASGPGAIYLDDLVLVDYHKTLVGVPQGPAGTLYAIQDGKQMRIGCHGRFELTFYRGRWTAWYDLAADRDRTRNLLGPEVSGLEVYQVTDHSRFDRLPRGKSFADVRTALTTSEGNRIDFRIEYFLAESRKEGPDHVVVYRIHPDGLILVGIETTSGTNELGIGVAVDGRQGFDAVIGKLRNPAPKSNSRIEYVLFRRVGAAAGADLLMAAKPWKNAVLPVQCRLRSAADPRMLQAVFTGEATTGTNTLHIMIRVWPADIDNLGNAEIHVRKFLEANTPDLKPQTGTRTWQPIWSIK